MRGLIAAVGVIVVVGAVVVLGRSEPAKGSGPGTTTDVAQTGTGKAPATPSDPAVVFPVKIVLECEEPTTIDAKTKDGQEVLHMREISDGATVKFMEVDNGFIDRCKLGEDKKEAGKLPGRASYVFDAPRKDTYYVYLRSKWRDNCGNSAWVKIDDGQWFNLEDELGLIELKNFTWAWHPLWVGGAPKGFELTAGPHTLWFNVREDGPKLDQWLISTEAQPPAGPNPVKK